MRFKLLDEVIIVRECSNAITNTIWIVAAIYGERFLLERDIYGTTERMYSYESQCIPKPNWIWNQPVTEETTKELEAQPLIDVLTGTARLIGMCTFDKSFEDERLMREAELFLLRKEAIIRLQNYERRL